MLKIVKIFCSVIIFSVVLSLCIAATDEMNFEFPVIEDSGVVEALSVFYCPDVSDNVVDSFFEGDAELGAAKSGKFSVSATQGGGRYISEVFRRQGYSFTDNSLKFDHYFSVINFNGESITVNIAPNTDVKSGYAVYSNVGMPEASFEQGVLSVEVKRAQLLKVVFDDSVGKTIYILVGYKNFIGSFDVERLLDSGISSIIPQGNKGNVNYTYPLKTFVDNRAVYYSAVCIDSVPYVTADIYKGTYVGSDAVRYKGDLYLPIDSFIGNGNIKDVCYDKASGSVRFTTYTSDYVYLSNFKSEKGTVLSENSGSITFYDNDSADSKGVLTEISPEFICNANSLKLSAKASMSGMTTGLKVKLSILAYNALGETVVLSEANIRAYGKEYDSVVYFDVSPDGVEYECWYMAITIEEAPGVTVTMRNIKLEIFEVSAGIGDNEFNPF